MRAATRLLIILLSVFSSIPLYAQCAPPTTAGTVRICTPAAGATVASPVSVQASAAPPSGQVITAMRLYVDSVAQYTSNSASLTTSVNLAGGGHRLVVNAWTNTGAVFSAVASITVSSASGAVAVTINPTSATVAPGATTQFQATVSGASDTSVTWQVDGAAGGSSTTGTISPTGLYTAPTTTGTHTVTAVSNADATKSASASVNVSTSTACTPMPSTVTICAPAAGASVTSPVTVQAVAGAPSGTTINAMRLYVDSVAQYNTNSASLSTSVGLAVGTHRLVVNAWSNTGAVFSSSVVINVVSSNGGAVSVTVSPSTANIAPNMTAQFTASVQNNSDQSVVWSVDGTIGGSATAGTISTAGLYTAPGTTGQHTVTATSNADNTKSANAIVTVASQTSCSSAAGTVSICAPAAGSTVSSPVTFVASAAAPSGGSISAIRLYIDSVSIVTMNGGSLNTTQTVANGTHNIVVNAWTNTGAALSARESITVGQATGPSVTVSPTTASIQISTTKQFTATVQNSTSNTVAWSVDGVVGGNATNGTVDTTGLYSAPATPGSHTITATLTSDNTTHGTATANVYSPSSGGNGVYTYMYNNMRTGANTNETKLTVAAVTNGANFGKKGTWSLDAAIYTQPLYVPNVTMSNGTFNVLYVGTENDSVYALNADSPGQVLWKRNFLTSTATIGTGYTGGRTSIGGNVGITGTPVIDPTTNRLYVVTRTTENNSNVQRLRAIDIRTGADVVPNVVIQGSVAGTGMGNNGAGQVPFQALTQNQRPGLLLSNGVVYVTFAAFSDYDPYHGWMFAYDAGTLNPIALYNDTPNSGGGGIWSSGAAPAADANGNIYVASANGRPDATAVFNPPSELPNTLIKLHLNGTSLAMTDYFSPYNTRCLSADDLDLGSSSPVLIPDQFNGMNLLALGSKEGRVYLVNRDSMGHWQSGSDSQIPSSVLFNAQGACGSSTFDANSPWRVYGAPAYWNGNIYFGSAFGPLRQYNITTGKLQQVALGTHVYAASGQNGRGPLTVVSANGTSDGIVWTAENDLNGNGWLRAYTATNVSNNIYTSNFGGGANFIIPTVVNGKVFVTGHNIVYEYGLLQ